MRLALIALAACGGPQAPLMPLQGVTATSVEPSHGKTGTRVTIHGKGFAIQDIGILVYFGDTAVPTTHVRDEEIVVEAPVGTPGTIVDVRLSYEGYAPMTFPRAFTYDR